MKIRVVPVCVCGLLALIGFAHSASGQIAAVEQRFAVSGAVGVFRPTDSAVVDVYGHSLLPLTLQGEVRLFPDVAVFAGFKSVRGDGTTVVTGPPVVDETYSTSLRVSSLRFGGTVAVPVAPRVTLAGSVGIGINWYEERWHEAGLSVNGRTTGFLTQAEFRYALTSRWSGFGRVEYAAIGTDRSGNGGVTARLGGLDFGAGIRFGF